MPVSSIDTLFCMSSKSTDLDTILKFLLCFHMLSPTQGGFYSLSCRFWSWGARGLNIFFFPAHDEVTQLGFQQRTRNAHSTNRSEESVSQTGNTAHGILALYQWLYFLIVAVRERPVEKVGRPHWEWSNHPTLSRSTRCCREADTTENEMTILYLKKLLLVRIATNQQEWSNYLVLRKELQRSCEAGLVS